MGSGGCGYWCQSLESWSVLVRPETVSQAKFVPGWMKLWGSPNQYLHVASSSESFIPCVMIRIGVNRFVSSPRPVDVGGGDICPSTAGHHEWYGDMVMTKYMTLSFTRTRCSCLGQPCVQLV